jgi:hypothetical protein
VVAKFNFKTHLKNTFFLAISSAYDFAKNANLKRKNLSQKMQFGYKNAEFDADFESVEKVAK